MRTRSDVERSVSLWKTRTWNSGINKVYWQHLIKYGDEAQLHIFDKTRITFKSIRVFYTKKEQGIKRDDSLARARLKIYRICRSNIRKHGAYNPVFFTLTFAVNVKELKPAHEIFKNFIKRLNYRLKKKIKYIVVPEFQERGAVHYHGVFFNLPWIPVTEFREIWGQGSVDLQTVRVIKNISAYISKYMSKQSLDRRLYGQKLFFCARGIHRPLDFIDRSTIDFLIQNEMMVERSSHVTSTKRIINYESTKMEIR